MVGWAGGSAAIASWQGVFVVRPYNDPEILANNILYHIQESLRNNQIMSRDLMEDSSSLNQDEPLASSFTDSVEDGLDEEDASSELDESDSEEYSSSEGSSEDMSEEESSGPTKEKEEEQLEEEEHEEALLAHSLAVGSQEHNHMLDYDELKLADKNKKSNKQQQQQQRLLWNMRKRWWMIH
jgi:hypothetical protein